MEWMLDPQAWIALLILTMLEIVLGIDNIIFISIFVGRLPEQARKKARLFGLALAMMTRIGLLLALTWIIKLTEPLFVILAEELSGRDLLLISGGLFLLTKSTLEIHKSMEEPSHANGSSAAGSFLGTIVQIAIIDIVFSFDSVITAVGMAQHIEVMVLAIVLSVVIMMMASGSVSRFVDEHPTVKMLALSFLILIGVALIADGVDVHIPKGYIYFAIAFSLVVEMLNIRVRRKGAQPLAADEAIRKTSKGAAVD